MKNTCGEALYLPLEMIAWEDLILYAKEIITAINEIRDSTVINHVSIEFFSKCF